MLTAPPKKRATMGWRWRRRNLPTALSASRTRGNLFSRINQSIRQLPLYLMVSWDRLALLMAQGKGALEQSHGRTSGAPALVAASIMVQKHTLIC